MEWNKVKSILIVLLLVVNLLLGFNIYSQISEHRAEENAGLRSALTLLREAGAQFDEQLFFDMPSSPAICLGVRSALREAELAEVLLGTNELDEAGGGIRIYTSPAGSVTFRSGGVFEAELIEGTTAEALLESILQKTTTKSILYEKTVTENGVDAQLLLDGRTVMGAVLKCVDSDVGARASGNWYFGEESRHEGVGATRTEMVISLLRLEREERLEITGLHMMYSMEQVRSGVRFVPVWQVELKNAQILLSGSTKRELSLE